MILLAILFIPINHIIKLRVVKIPTSVLDFFPYIIFSFLDKGLFMFSIGDNTYITIADINAAIKQIKQEKVICFIPRSITVIATVENI
jgi:hypothetical protein